MFFLLCILHEYLFVLLRGKAAFVDQFEFQLKILILVHFLFLTKLSNELVYLAERQPFAFLRFHAIVSLDYHFEQFDRAMQKLHFRISQLLKLLFLELAKADLKQLLLIKTVRELHEDKNVIVLSFCNHVLAKYLDERVHFKEFDDGKVVNNLSS